MPRRKTHDAHEHHEVKEHKEHVHKGHEGEMIQCMRCRKRTPSSHIEKHVTKNNRHRLSAKCTVCGANKSKMVGGNLLGDLAAAFLG